VKELYFDEFNSLLLRHFRNVRFLGQRIHPSSSIWPIGAANADGFHEFVMERGDTAFEFVDNDTRVPLYFIAIASNAAAVVSPSGSVLLDQSDSLLEEKDQATRWRERQVTEREQTIKALEEAMQWREKQLQETSEALAWTQGRIGELETKVAGQAEALEWRAQQVDVLSAGKEHWEGVSAARAIELETTRDELKAANRTIEKIYDSRGWKLLTKLRRIRDTIMGRGKARG
jgi:hypothetical protein